MNLQDTGVKWGQKEDGVRILSVNVDMMMCIFLIHHIVYYY